MQNYVLSCCSTADLSHDHFASRDIHHICFHYYMDGVEYTDDLGKTMSSEDFYAATDACVVITSDGKTLVIGLGDATETRAFYESLMEKVGG